MFCVFLDQIFCVFLDPFHACAHCLHMRRNKEECCEAVRDHHESLGFPLQKYANVPEEMIEQIAAEVMRTGVAESLELPESAEPNAAAPTPGKKAPPKAPPKATPKALFEAPPKASSKAGLSWNIMEYPGLSKTIQGLRCIKISRNDSNWPKTGVNHAKACQIRFI